RNAADGGVDGLARTEFPQRSSRATSVLNPLIPRSPRDCDKKGDGRQSNKSRGGWMAPGMLDGAFDASDGPCEDRVAFFKSIQVIGQVRRAGVAAQRILVQAFEANSLQIARCLGVQVRRRHGVRGEHLSLRFRGVFTSKWRTAREHLVQ